MLGHYIHGWRSTAGRSLFLVAILVAVFLFWLIGRGKSTVEVILRNPSPNKVVVSVEQPEGFRALTLPEGSLARVEVKVGSLIVRGTKLRAPIHLVTREDDGREIMVAK